MVPTNKRPFLPLREHKSPQITLATGVLISIIVDTKIFLSAVERAQMFRGDLSWPCANIIYSRHKDSSLCHREDTGISRGSQRPVC